MSSGVQQDEERTELLGSLTTEQQQRTSARVIKKLRLEPQIDKRDVIECETPNKIDDKDPLKFPTVKQRMPKALWSADEKSLFFEALNEYGKDFDSITSYICAKMKKKGMLDGNLKTKTQVSHFYYRTWHKLSKHVRFDENVKKVAQELYALINYGELRRKLVSVNEKICARLGEMVRGGSIAVRTKGKTIRVRTPMCRALRRLNQIAERAYGARVCTRAQVLLRARDAASWTRVQAAAHNPRTVVTLTLRTRLVALLLALERRWKCISHVMLMENGSDLKTEEYSPTFCENGDKLDEHLNLETDRTILRERAPPVVSLHVGPRPDADVRLPELRPREPLSSQKICFASYLERMGALRRQDGDVKIRTPKRHRKDSVSDKDKENEKKIKIDDIDTNKLINIEETAIDGIELMAHYKNNQEDEEKPSTEEEKEMKAEEITEEDSEKDKDMIERDSDILDRDVRERDKDMLEREKEMPDRDKDMLEREKDSFSEMEDDEKYNKSDTDNESDGREKKQMKYKNLKVKFCIRPKKRGGSVYTLVLDHDKNKEEDAKIDEKEEKEEEQKPDIDVELAMRQIRKGWSVGDAGELTIGDLYLMFGSRSRLELDYWWAEPTPPLPKTRTEDRVDRREKGNKTPDKGDSSVEDERERCDNDILSPKNTYSQDSNDGLSGDERKSEQLSSPDHKSGAVKLVNKLINRPTNTRANNGYSLVSDRLRRLLALAGNSHFGGGARGVHARRHGPTHQVPKPPACSVSPSGSPPVGLPLFRHPTPIAPKPDLESCQSPLSLEGLPKWRRGRPTTDRRVVVQRLLPLMPKLPPPNNLIPVKMVSNSQPVQPRLVPKPPPTSSSDLSMYYVLSQSNGQFFFHDGDRRIPIHTSPGNTSQDTEDAKADDGDVKEDKESDIKIVKVESVTENGGGEGRTHEQNDISSFLPSESLSLSPSRLLRSQGEADWLDTHDFSLSSFLSHLEKAQQELPVDSHLQSLMAESSVDYVAKFADLAAEVDDQDLSDDLP
ncbi:unnamed protein product [Danaus chrysippus]|uniref:(African queen) hypothetical protein n=1 Tax=Danaus chrysippus TaxID=151541 RepID=A0A8J2R6V7_9NEOP|nr:unnamed protein product [Danaus chrysippus]